MTIAVNPNGTTQNCSACGQKVEKSLSDRWHSCHCGCELDRDHNAAINIKKSAVGHPVDSKQSSGNVRWDTRSHSRSQPSTRQGEGLEYVTLQNQSAFDER